ncbi:MAG: hypothetical protein ACJA1E_000697 [Paracoccaceae bacterium]|jgi:hypothetical protein
MMKYAPLLVIVLLAACGTPLERCVSRETREIRIVDSLIFEVRNVLARGYKIEREEFRTSEYQLCEVEKDVDGEIISRHFCWKQVTQYRDKAVSVDLDEERRKLKQLEVRREILVQLSGSAIEQCKATYAR